MSKGLTDAGLNIIAGIDIWDKAINSYKKNFHHTAICEDLTKLTPDKFNTLYNTDNKTIDLIVGGPPCFIAGTQVLTNTGYKNIEDITLADKLLTHQNIFQNICNLQKKTYNGNIYDIKLKYHGDIITCTEEHPFYVREKHKYWNTNLKTYNTIFGEPKWKEAKELTNNDYCGMVINTNSIIPEFTFDEPTYWYILGTYIYQKCINIPEWIQNAPTKYIQEFINGFTSNRNDINIFENLSHNLAYGLQRLYFKLGKYVFINQTQNLYSINLENCEENYDKNCDDIFIENNYVWFEPSSIKKRDIINIPVYNFEVETDNSYIVYNTIVHNCQGMSIAGKRDINDPRNSLFIEYVKYLDYFNPKSFIMENVIGILSMKTANNENVIDIIMKSLTKKYNCVICKLYASDFEVPQNRRRIIIIGIRKNLNIIPIEPKPILTIETRKAVITILLPKESVDASHFLSATAIQGIINKKAKSKANNNGFGAQFLVMNKPSYTIPARYWKDGYDALVKYSDTEIRRLSILELKRIQSFPDDYIIEGSKKDIIMQIGNAVACRFAYHLGKHIINTLRLE